MKILKWIIVVMCSAVLITFALVNRQWVTLHLFPLPFEMDIPVFLLVFLLLMIGALMGGVSGLYYTLSCYKKLKALALRNTGLEQEIAGLKATVRTAEPGM